LMNQNAIKRAIENPATKESGNILLELLVQLYLRVLYTKACNLDEAFLEVVV